jgi:hypothetical protein
MVTTQEPAMEWQKQDGQSLEDRKKAFEAKFRLDQEMAFKIDARRNKLLGRWVAERLGLTGEERDAYARAVVMAGLAAPGHGAMTHKIQDDLAAAGIDVAVEEIGDRMIRLADVARDQVLNEISPAKTE